MSSNRNNIYGASYDELAEIIASLDEPAYRTGQVWQWLYRHLVADFDAMTNLPQSLRAKLGDAFEFSPIEVASNQFSSDNQTEKVLFKLADDAFIETVLMRYEKRRTVCISTQVGCAMGCVFCATGQMGFVRNLNTAEIISQVIYFSRKLKKDDQQITNIVFMGMGEPLHNYDNSLAAVDTLTHPKGYGLGARKITISTVGHVPNIRRFADEQRQTKLAISLHASTDQIRSKLIPIARRWPLAELLESARYYVLKTGRRITFEWALIEGRNDSPEEARRLGALLEGLLCHVNLIPLNPTRSYHGKPSPRARVQAFQKELVSFGISSSVRVRRGIDIEAGCGQLRERFTNDDGAR